MTRQNFLLTGRNPCQNHSQGGAAICRDQLGLGGSQLDIWVLPIGELSTLWWLQDHILFDVLFLTSSGSDLQFAAGWYATEFAVAGMRVSASMSETMVLSWKRVECSPHLMDELLPQVEEFKYLGPLFMSEGKSEQRLSWHLQ